MLCVGRAAGGDGAQEAPQVVRGHLVPEAATPAVEHHDDLLRGIEPERSRQIGVVNAVSEKGTLDAVVAEFVEKQILPKSASSIRMASDAARVSIREYWDSHIEACEKLYLDKLMSTADAVEGIEAFLEKRPPKWVDG